jgi:endopeptidase Clp ATP-binding regulatory subunit ClpX
MATKTPHCSFCGRPKNEVKALIPSQNPTGSYICDSCIDEGGRALAAHIRRKATDSKEGEPLPLPKEIIAALDEYVIGQDMAKKHVAAAVYKHYKRRDLSLRDVKLPDGLELQKSNILITGPSGCHRKGQKVLMVDGTLKTVEDIRVGEALMGPDGTPRVVQALARGEDRMVKIQPTKGEPWVVNENHILTLVRTSKKSHGRYRKTSDLVDVTVKEWLGWSRTQKACHKLLRVKVSAFQGEATRLPVDPYALGALLGDGSFWGSPQIHTESDEVLGAVSAEAKNFGLHVQRYHEDQDRCPTYALVGGKGGRPKKNKLTAALESLGLWGCRSDSKFVPQLYKTAPWHRRLELLAGYLDTDGHLHGNTYDAVSKSQALLEDMAFVARSLGFAAYPKPCVKKSQNGTEGTYYRMCISGDVSAIPVRIPKKKATPRKQVKNVQHTGFDAKPLGREPFYGLVVDGDHRYLLDDFTVTHNCGKTQIARTIAKILGVPFYIQDATKLTQAGYVGDDVDVILQGLLEKCDWNVERAQWGICVIDEIDKIARKSGKRGAGYRDVTGEGVQQAILKLVEGGEVTIAKGKGARLIDGSQQETITIDTSNILFIGMGSFDGIQETVNERMNKGAAVGFGAKSKKKDLSDKEIYADLSEDDILDFGIIPELAGRMPVLTGVLQLTKEELIRIMTEPKDALVKQEQFLYEMEGVELVFPPEALDAIAEKATERKTGARALRSIVANLLLDYDLETPGSDITRIEITADYVNGTGEPAIQRKTQAQVQAQEA